MFECLCQSCNNQLPTNCVNIKRKNEISLVNAIITSNVVVNPEEVILFDANRVCVGSDIIHTKNGTEFVISSPGIYQASISTNARLNRGERVPTVSVALVINGLMIPGAIATQSCGPNDIRNLITQFVFCVKSGQIVKVSAMNPIHMPITVYDNASIVIEKIG